MTIKPEVLPGYPAWLKALFPPLGHDVDVPVEPALSGDELVAVRQLIEERFPLNEASQPAPLTALASAVGAQIDAAGAPFYGVFHQLLETIGFKPATPK